MRTSPPSTQRRRKTTPNFTGYHRFEYRRDPEPDIGPPHGIWDHQTNAWAGIGTFPEESQARLCAHAMNHARSICETIPARSLASALHALRQLTKELEALSTGQEPSKIATVLQAITERSDA